jgi:hypothetical protein
MKCEHPDHNDNETCEDRAVACHQDCTCCLPPLVIDYQGCQHKHKAHFNGVGTNPEWVAVCTDCGAPLDKDGKPLPEHKPKPSMEPPAGSWAAVARMMAQGDDSGFDWDQWKDEMKERDL